MTIGLRPRTCGRCSRSAGGHSSRISIRVITYRGRTILVSGLTHIYSDRLPESAMRQYLNAAPQADLRILLVHQPAEDVVEAAADAGYDLVLAGHTHGGQIVFHPLGIPLTPSMRETKYYRGHHKVGETHVVVTRGVGLTLAPIRYHARAEVTSMTVVLQAAAMPRDEGVMQPCEE